MIFIDLAAWHVKPFLNPGPVLEFGSFGLPWIDSVVALFGMPLAVLPFNLLQPTFMRLF